MFVCVIDEFQQTLLNAWSTRAFANALKNQSPNCSFCFLSGQGADQSEKSSMMFARGKGVAENALISLNFNGLHIFRPGYIYPISPRKEPNLSYRILRTLYKPLLSKVYPNIGVSSEKLAETMTEVGINGSDNLIFENNDIRNYGGRLPDEASAQSGQTTNG